MGGHEARLTMEWRGSGRSRIPAHPFPGIAIWRARLRHAFRLRGPLLEPVLPVLAAHLALLSLLGLRLGLRSGLLEHLALLSQELVLSRRDPLTAARDLGHGLPLRVGE